MALSLTHLLRNRARSLTLAPQLWRIVNGAIVKGAQCRAVAQRVRSPALIRLLLQTIDGVLLA
jgi:hypothetical protein